jgi:acid phosphatase
MLMVTIKNSAIALAVIGTLSTSSSVLAESVTPIKHLIVVVGENVSFDTLYGTYIPPANQSILNLVSQGIVNADGTPGPNYAKAIQKQAVNKGDQYSISPKRTTAYEKLPTPSKIGLLDLATFTFADGEPDHRFDSLNLNGPFQITKFADYMSGIGDPVHRFFQMWQQTGGDNRRHDLFTWTASTAGAGNETAGVTADNPGQGGEQMGFYNMNQGDAPFFKSLAQQYAISDNYHQSIMGGTGANFIALATGDVAVYQKNGLLETPPVNQIENPSPQLGLLNPNFFTHDGYSGGSYVNCSDNSQPGVAPISRFLKEKGIKKNCEDGAYYLVNNYEPAYDITGTLKTNADGLPKFEDAGAFVYPPQTKPTIGELLSSHHVSWKWYTAGRDDADASNDALFPIIYGRTFAAVKAAVPAGTPDSIIQAIATPKAIAAMKPLLYNTLGDPLNASANVNNSALKNNLKGLNTFLSDVQTGQLPEVSFVIPKNLDSGHPGYSAPARYEAFLADLVAKVQANPALYASTAIVITTDEGGGYFDSGYIQNVDFFGDGTRIPFIVVSPYAKKGFVDHTYYDHTSVLKFIERNWRLSTLSNRSRDNLPNPKQARENDNPGKCTDADAYIPRNAPAVGDLMNLFRFSKVKHQED